MNKIIIADASPLIAFCRIGKLSFISNTLGDIIIPKAVAEECLIDSSRPGANAIQKAIKENIISIYPNPMIQKHDGLLNFLGQGEAHAIVLALQLKTGLLVDDQLGRKAAKKAGLKIIGTAGVLLLAKQKKLIKKLSPILNELKQSGYYLSNELTKEILKRAKEKI